MLYTVSQCVRAGQRLVRLCIEAKCRRVQLNLGETPYFSKFNDPGHVLREDFRRLLSNHPRYKGLPKRRQGAAVQSGAFSFGLFVAICLVLPVNGVEAQGELRNVDRFSFFSRIPNHQICRMLFSSDARKRFGVSEEEFKAIKQILDQTAKSIPAPVESVVKSKSDLSELLDLFYKDAETRESQLSIALHRAIAPKEFDELLAMYLQFFGYEAIVNPVVATRLKISEDQITEIRRVAEEFRVRKSVFFVEVAKNQQPIDRNSDALRPFLSLRSDAINTPIEKILTPSQRRSLSEIMNYRVTLSNGEQFSYPTFGW